MVGSQPGQIVHKTVSWKTFHKNRAGGVAQGEGPSTAKKKKDPIDFWFLYLDAGFKNLWLAYCQEKLIHFFFTLIGK
jgi:hypothetical protein